MACPFSWRSSSVTVACLSRGKAMPCCLKTSLMVFKAFNASKLMNGAHRYIASRSSMGVTPTFSAALAWAFSWGKVCIVANMVQVISSRPFYQDLLCGIPPEDEFLENVHHFRICSLSGQCPPRTARCNSFTAFDSVHILFCFRSWDILCEGWYEA